MTSSYDEISSTSATTPKERISISKLTQILNSRRPVSAVQKEAHVLRSKRKTVEISQGDPIKVAALATKSKVLKRLVRNLTKTRKARLNNTK